MKKNFNAIADLGSDLYHLRCAILLADDKTLRFFEKGFPHLFEEGDDSGPLYVPLSLLQETAYNKLKTSGEYPDAEAQRIAHFDLESADFDIPLAFQWGAHTNNSTPDGVLDQLIGQCAGAGMKVQYRGREYVILSVVFEGQDPRVGAMFRRKPRVRYLSLADAAFIDLNT